jgi:lysophospholipid acyltransferase (LPLAT)-like uncharacterized protein
MHACIYAMWHVIYGMWHVIYAMSQPSRALVCQAGIGVQQT